MIKYYSRRSAALFVLSVGIYLTVQVAPWHQDTFAFETVSVPFVSGTGCDIDCTDDEPYCAGGEHDAWDTHPNFYFWTRNGGAHAFPWDCRPGACDTMHGPYCPLPGLDPMTNAQLEELRTSILSEDVWALSAMVAARSGEVKVNLQRSAIQLVNCDGDVFMHLPIALALAKAVTTAAAVVTTP